MRRALVLAVALLGALPAAADAQRPRGDARVLALVPPPGFPAMAYVAPNGRIYEGTYDNPAGDTVASRVFEFTGAGTLLRSWTIRGQDLSGPHGVQVGTFDGRGRLILLDKSPPRVIRLNRVTGEQTTIASFPAGAVPNYAAWGPDRALYVTDYHGGKVWRIAPGAQPQAWAQDPLLDGGEFGPTGIALAPDRTALLVAVQSAGGGFAAQPTSGRILRVPFADAGRPGPLTTFWESAPFDGPDGFAIAQSGTVYIANLLSNQIAVIGADGAERERLSSPLFDAPSSVRFLGTRLIIANQAYATGDRAKQAILDVESGEAGRPEFIPKPKKKAKPKKRKQRKRKRG